MEINGKEVKINSYETDPRLALQYFKVSGGKYKVIDRGKSQDKFFSKIKVEGDPDNIKTIVNEVNASREQSITLSNFYDNEKIFGTNIDYSQNIEAAFLDYNIMEQKNLETKKMNFELYAVNPSFVGGGAMPELRNLEIGYSSGSTFSVNTQIAYNGNVYYNDMDEDEIYFEGKFSFTISEAKQLLEYIRDNNRGKDYTIDTTTISGVPYPFGYNHTESSNTCKLTEWKEVNWQGLDRIKIKLKFVKV